MTGVAEPILALVAAEEGPEGSRDLRAAGALAGLAAGPSFSSDLEAIILEGRMGALFLADASGIRLLRESPGGFSTRGVDATRGFLGFRDIPTPLCAANSRLGISTFLLTELSLPGFLLGVV